MNIPEGSCARRKKSLEASADLVLYIITCIRKTTVHSVVRWIY